MTYIPSSNFGLEVSKGNVPGHSPVIKFGRAPDGVQSSLTDIWDRADATPTQQIWVAPTQARIHAIVSTSTDDDGSPVGTGARTVQVYGLTDWDTAEVSETVTMDGTTPVNTANSYVIIHRLWVASWGSAGPNVGTISATAATDATITAIVRPTIGSTEMAVYGLPSTQKFYIEAWQASLMKASGGAADVTMRLCVNTQPETSLTGFTERETEGLQSTGVSSKTWTISPPLQITGPAIVKMQGIGSTNDLDVTGSFHGTLVTNS